MMRFRRRLGTLLIIVGLGIALVPFLQKAYGAYSQWQMNREFDAASRQAQHSQLPGTILTAHALTAWKQFFSVRAAQAAPKGNAIIFGRPLHLSSKNAPKMGLVRMEIPKIHLRAMVTDNAADWHQLAKAPAHFRGTALPGQAGNCAIAGHRNVYGSWFRHLNKLRPGDAIILRTPKQKFIYRVTKAKIVATNNTKILAATPDATLTLVTCMIPYAKHRLVIWGKMG